MSAARALALRVKLVVFAAVLASALGVILAPSQPWLAIALGAGSVIANFFAVNEVNLPATHGVYPFVGVLHAWVVYSVSRSVWLGLATLAFITSTLATEMFLRLTGYNSWTVWLGGTGVMLLLIAAELPLSGLDFAVAPITAFALVLCVLGAGRGIPIVRHRPGLRVHAGDEAPDFELSPRGGGPALRLSDLRGRPVILLFLRGDWCPVCQIQMRAYQRAKGRLASDVHLVGISQSMGTEALHEVLGASFTILEDPKNQVAERYGVVCRNCGPHNDAPVPSSFLIGEDGKIEVAPRETGAFRFDDLSDVLQKLEVTA